MIEPLPPRPARTTAPKVVQRLAGEIGARPATSTAEAHAAADVAALMRRHGLQVTLQPIVAAQRPTLGLGLLAGAGALTALVGVWLPLPSLLLALVLLALALRELVGPPTLAALLGRRPSQNVIGTRAAQGPPKQRIVLLCHLDSPRMVAPGWSAPLRYRLLAIPLGLGALVMLLGGVIAGLLGAGWLAMPGLALGAAAAIAAIRERTARWTCGAVDAAGIAAVLQAIEASSDVTAIELWAVALGAGAAAGSGLAALLDTYPFPADETWFINVPWLGRGETTLVVGEGLWWERAPDAAFAVLFADQSSPSVRLERKRYRGERLDSARLLARGFRALSVVGLGPDGRAAGFRSPDDSPELIETRRVERAGTLIARAIAALAARPSEQDR